MIIPFYLLTYIITNSLNKKVERKVMEHSAELESQLVESVNGMKTIKSFGMEYHANIKTEVRFVNLLGSVYRSGKNAIFSTNASLAISRLFTVILLWVGAGYVIDQTITPGELMSFYAIIGYFTGPVSSLIGSNRSFQNAMIAADRLFEIMDLEGNEGKDYMSIGTEEVGDITFKEVSFRYGTRKQVLDQLNLTIKKGEITAIIGESGSGKSTIAAILKRMYPLDSGKIMIGHYDLAGISKDSINELIGIVPQQVDLFAGTVIENIAVGEFEPDTKQIVQLAHDLGALEFINELPGGFGSYLGENGTNLSGGQRQRLAILRTLYRNPEIIIFDEATSALDSKSEELVLRTILRLRDQGKTVIAITHRMAAMPYADNIIVLDKGKVVGVGNHGSLQSENAFYQTFWSDQQGMKIINENKN